MVPGRKTRPPPSLPATPTELLSAADAALPDGAVSALPDTLLAWADVMDSFGPDNFVTLQVLFPYFCCVVALVKRLYPLPPLLVVVYCSAARVTSQRVTRPLCGWPSPSYALPLGTPMFF